MMRLVHMRADQDVGQPAREGQGDVAVAQMREGQVPHHAECIDAEQRERIDPRPEAGCDNAEAKPFMKALKPI